LSLDNIISQLATMAGPAEAGMHNVDLSFTLGEASELWTQVFLPIKEDKKKKQAFIAGEQEMV
jgi:m7GpppX diphosphatase